MAQALSAARLPAAARLSLVGVALLSISCRSLDRFDTSGDPAFCGNLVAGPSFHDGFIAGGEPPDLNLHLELDTSQLSSFSDNNTALPGTLTSDDAGHGLCGSQALFDHSPLRAIPQVYHDTLSTLTFGEGHDEDFFGWVDSTCQGTMLTLVSLLRNGSVEMRLFKPAPLPPVGAGPEQRPGFALFYLNRNDTGCAF